jgi:hypothetical protein
MRKKTRFTSEFQETLRSSLYFSSVLLCGGLAVLAVGSLGPSLFVCAGRWWNDNPRIDGYQRLHGEVVFSDGSTLPWFVQLPIAAVMLLPIWMLWIVATLFLNCLLFRSATRTALRWVSEGKLVFPDCTIRILIVFRRLTRRWKGDRNGNKHQRRPWESKRGRS